VAAAAERDDRPRAADTYRGEIHAGSSSTKIRGQPPRTASEDDVEDVDPRAASVLLALVEGRSTRWLRRYPSGGGVQAPSVAVVRAPSMATAAAARGLRRRRASRGEVAAAHAAGSGAGGGVGGAHGGWRRWRCAWRVAALGGRAGGRRRGIQPPPPGARAGEGFWRTGSRDAGKKPDARSKLISSVSTPR
jgi:hypothetical protein